MFFRSRAEKENAHPTNAKPLMVKKVLPAANWAIHALLFVNLLAKFIPSDPAIAGFFPQTEKI